MPENHCTLIIIENIQNGLILVFDNAEIIENDGIDHLKLWSNIFSDELNIKFYFVLLPVVQQCLADNMDLRYLRHVVR